MKNEAIFVTYVLSEWIFLLNWINFLNIYTFTYLKTSLHTLSLLVPKIVDSFHCILKLLGKFSRMLKQVQLFHFPRRADSKNSFVLNTKKWRRSVSFYVEALWLLINLYFSRNLVPCKKAFLKISKNTCEVSFLIKFQV